MLSQYSVVPPHNSSLQTHLSRTRYVLRTGLTPTETNTDSEINCVTVKRKCHEWKLWADSNTTQGNLWFVTQQKDRATITSSVVLVPRLTVQSTVLQIFASGSVLVRDDVLGWQGKWWRLDLAIAFLETQRDRCLQILLFCSC